MASSILGAKSWYSLQERARAKDSWFFTHIVFAHFVLFRNEPLMATSRVLQIKAVAHDQRRGADDYLKQQEFRVAERNGRRHLDAGAGAE
jgi:hypothetical protein